MMEWQAVVLAVQILLLAAGWLLFQRARGDLAARAAEIPVLGEVRALQKSVKQLLVEIETASDRQALRLENGCAEAVALVTELETAMREAERRLADFEASISAIATARAVAAVVGQSTASRSIPETAHAAIPNDTTTAEPVSDGASLPVGYPAASNTISPRDLVYQLADSGQSTASIAYQTRLSEGEVETLLGLRARR